MWAVVRNLKYLAVVGVVVLGGLLASGSAEAQYLPRNGSPGPFPPHTGGRYGTYPYGPWGWNYGGWNYGGWNYGGWNYGGWNYGGWNYSRGYGYNRFPGYGHGYHNGGHSGGHGGRK
jgi:hypothetical protein